LHLQNFVSLENPEPSSAKDAKNVIFLVVSAIRIVSVIFYLQKETISKKIVIAPILL